MIVRIVRIVRCLCFQWVMADDISPLIVRVIVRNGRPWAVGRWYGRWLVHDRSL